MSDKRLKTMSMGSGILSDTTDSIPLDSIVNVRYNFRRDVQRVQADNALSHKKTTA